MSTFTGTGSSDTPVPRGPHRLLLGLPQHLQGWVLPPGWRWGEHGVVTGPRHAQEIIDAFGRSLALLSAPDPAHAEWLFAEAKTLANLNHPLFPTTYHFWTPFKGSTRGPGYLRRWISGETVGDRLRRTGPASVPEMIRVMRTVGSGLSYLHDISLVHGAVAPDAVYITPTGRLWLLGWQWAAGRAVVPAGVRPDPVWMPGPPEWGEAWEPTPASDQWQLGALCFAMLTGELPPRDATPPVYLVRPDCPASIAQLIDRMLQPEPGQRFETVVELLKTIERLMPGTTSVALSVTDQLAETDAESDEDRLRWATGIDYEVLSKLGSGTFGSVWRVRDLSLEREVALKMLHPRASESEEAIGRFTREARLAANLKHPAIVPVYDLDRRGDVVWYTMELQERGSLAELVGRTGPRLLGEIADEVDTVLDALAVAHARGIIHRDLKPENILIDRYRNWRIADFGIANAFGEQHAGASGTPAFAAPEQLLGEPQGPATDLFSVAAIVYYALTGRAPFEGTEAPVVLAQQLRGAVDLTGFGPDLARWLGQGLASDVADRFSDAVSMQLAWRHVVRHISRA
jgi:eukaryotic-like serine/threonine-protein kinase